MSAAATQYRVEQLLAGEPHRGCRRRRAARRADRRALAGPAAPTCGSSAEIFPYLALASLWNLLAGYRRAGLGRPAGLCRLRRLRALRLHHVPRRPSAAGRPDRRSRRRGCRHPRRGAHLPPARRLFRHRHLGHRRGLPPRLPRRFRRSAAAPAPACRSASSRPSPTAAPSAKSLHLLGGARHRRPRARLRLPAAALRAAGWRLRRSATIEVASKSFGIDIWRTKFLVYVVDGRADRRWSVR